MYELSLDDLIGHLKLHCRDKFLESIRYNIRFPPQPSSWSPTTARMDTICHELSISCCCCRSGMFSNHAWAAKKTHNFMIWKLRAPHKSDTDIKSRWKGKTRHTTAASTYLASARVFTFFFLNRFQLTAHTEESLSLSRLENQTINDDNDNDL